MQRRSFRHLALGAALALLAFSGGAAADPPSRVARIGYMSGAVSLSATGQGEWNQATLNRPLTTGDRLWTDDSARAEVQVGAAMVRMNAATGVSLLNLDDRIAQLQLSQGSLNVRVRRLEPNQVFEVDTPNLAFSLRQPGEYRIEVDPDGSATTIFVRRGQGEAYGDGASYVIDARQPYRFTGTDLSHYQPVAAPGFDEFDRWASDRDRRYDASASARYVSPEVIGAQDLDGHGSWRVDASYGNVWVPSGVPAGWAPYRYGHCAWIEPWGWTWVDDAPWGFAVSHYGRWANMQGTWGWVPGPMRVPAVYAPALVVFIGGGNFQLALSSGPVGGVAWFPLAPREVYRPAYKASRGYYEQVNRSNTVINNTVIQNTYNTTNVTNIVYANRTVPGAVVAVPTATFTQAQPVSRAAVRVTGDMLQRAPLASMPAVAPTEQSVRGAGARGDKPPARVFERPVIAHTAPPEPRTVAATAPQPNSAAVPGRAGIDTQRPEPRPEPAAPTRTVRVVEQPQATPPTRRPPPLQTKAGSVDAATDNKQRKSAEPTASPAAPLAAAPTPAQPAQPSAVARPPERPTPSAPLGEPRASGKSPEKPDTRPPAAVPAVDVAPKVASPPGRPPEPRVRPDTQGNAAAKSQAQPPPAAPLPPAKPVAISAAEPATATQAMPPRVQPSNPGPPKQAAPTPPEAAQAVQRGRPEPVQPSRPAQAQPPGAALAAAPAAPPEAAKPRPPAPRPKSPGGKPKDKANNVDEPKRDDAERKPKG